MELTSRGCLDCNTTEITQKDQIKRNFKLLAALSAFLLVGGFIITAPLTITNQKICQSSPEKYCGCDDHCSCGINCKCK
jgi:hypothetical protein